MPFLLLHLATKKSLVLWLMRYQLKVQPFAAYSSLACCKACVHCWATTDLSGAAANARLASFSPATSSAYSLAGICVLIHASICTKYESHSGIPDGCMVDAPSVAAFCAYAAGNATNIPNANGHSQRLKFLTIFLPYLKSQALFTVSGISIHLWLPATPFRNYSLGRLSTGCSPMPSSAHPGCSSPAGTVP